MERDSWESWATCSDNFQERYGLDYWDTGTSTSPFGPAGNWVDGTSAITQFRYSLADPSWWGTAAPRDDPYVPWLLQHLRNTNPDLDESKIQLSLLLLENLEPLLPAPAHQPVIKRYAGPGWAHPPRRTRAPPLTPLRGSQPKP